MKDGNLCYATQTTDSCSEEDKITVQIDSGNFTTGTVVIRDGEVVNTDVREIENFEGSIIMGGTISKSYNEETGESSIIVKIRFNDVLGEVEINNIVGMLEYDPNKYTFTKYYYGNWGGSDYTTGEYSDNTIMTVSVEDSNILVGDSAYVGYKFSTDDLDAVEDSDFTYYIRVGTKEHKNVPVQQDSSSGVSIVNYVNDFNDYFKAVKSDSYDYAPGDINDDGYIDGSDLSILRQYYLGNINQACKAMDVNGDGVIDISDLVRFKKYLGRYEAPELEYSPMTGIPGHL